MKLCDELLNAKCTDSKQTLTIVAMVCTEHFDVDCMSCVHDSIVAFKLLGQNNSRVIVCLAYLLVCEYWGEYNLYNLVPFIFVFLVLGSS